MTTTEMTNSVSADSQARVVRHSRGSRIRHALMIVTTFCLIATGFLMWAGLPDMSSLVATIHALLGLLFIGIPLVWLLTDFKHFSAFIDDVTTFDKNDAGWLAKAGGYLSKGHTNLPPQSKYNTGQKITAVLIIVSGIVLGITGPLMWLGSGSGFFGLFSLSMAPALINLLWRIHLIAAIVMVVLVAAHMAIVLMPRNVPVVNSMFGDGTVDMDYAKAHHERWVEEGVETV